MITTPKIALVTGATQGRGLALVEGLAHRLNTQDTVYLTGRDAGRVAQAVESLPGGGARVRGEVLDVADPEAANRLAAQLRERHGGIDIVFNNAVMRVGPDDDPRAVVDEYAEVNNFGTCEPSRRCCRTTGDSSSSPVRWAPCTTWRPCCTTASTAWCPWTRWTSRSRPGVTPSRTAARAAAHGRVSSTSRPRSVRSPPSARSPNSDTSRTPRAASCSPPPVPG
jgi:NAD(P)-dependent dehydrogenase (short-subunit alcohol dehydrogenase family)